jgi:hypothetical protein
MQQEQQQQQQQHQELQRQGSKEPHNGTVCQVASRTTKAAATSS